MKQKVEAEYQSWLRDVESKLNSDAEKEAWKTVAGAVGQEVFGGHLREADYYRKLNEMTEQRRTTEAEAAKYQQERAAFDRDVAAVSEWFQREQPKNQRLLEERNALANQLASAKENLKQYGLEDEVPDAPKVKANDRGYVNEDTLRDEIQALRQTLTQYDRALPKILADYGTVLNRMQKDGFDVDPSQVIAYTTANGVDLTKAYEDLTAEQRREKYEAELTSHIEKVKEEARREALSKIPSAGGSLRPSGPSIQEMVTNAEQFRDPQKRVAAAVQDWLSGEGR